MDNSPHRKLDPQCFPNMSLQKAAILGFVLEREYTTPTLAADLRANLSRLGMAAGLDQEEWTQFAALVRSRLGMELGELAGESRP